MPGQTADRLTPEPDPISDAVLALFVERGFAGFSMADVAAAAGVAEADVTRRGARADLVNTALERQVPSIPSCPDTGTLRGDLLGVVRWQIHVIVNYSTIMDRSVELAQQSAEYAAAARESTTRRRALYRPVLERAIARGELDSDLDDDATFDFVFGQVYSRYVSGRPISDEIAESVVDLVLAGLERPEGGPEQ